MKILGIVDTMTSGAAVLVDGKIEAAVSEERMIRKKMALGFPEMSINEVLDLSGVSVADLDCVAVATNREVFYYPAREWTGWFQKGRGFVKGAILNIASTAVDLFGDNDFLQKCHYLLKTPSALTRKKKIKQLLREKWQVKCPIVFVDHHFSHAAAAYFTSGYDKATVVSLDGGGDGKSARIYKVDGGRFTELASVSAYNSIGNFYGYITHLCGYKAHKHEGKISGLAAHGKTIYKDILNGFITYRDGEILNISRSFYYSSLRKLRKALPSDFKHEDLAASIQKHLEEVVTEFVSYWVDRSGYGDIPLVGGLFANVRLNQEIKDLDNVSNIFVYPAMGDGGLAVGAAYVAWMTEMHKQNRQAKSYRPNHVFFGRGYTNGEIEDALKESGVQYVHHENIELKVAQILAEGKVVARFTGKMEYGPRALCHRSILYQTTDPTVNEWLNKKLQRTEFMPFAPVTLDDHVDQCYYGGEGGMHAARFMTVTFHCTDWMKENCPAVVHVDGTARPQIVSRELDPHTYTLIDEYRKITGLPSIINTSFNMHEEPIVCSPRDAIRAFQLGHLEVLAIGNFIVESE